MLQSSHKGSVYAWLGVIWDVLWMFIGRARHFSGSIYLEKLNVMLQNIEQLSCNHLKMLNAKLQHIEQDISHAKACREDRSCLVSRGTALGFCGMGVATGVAFAYLYFRYRQKV